MDPFSTLGVTASIIACIQLTGALLKRVGPSEHSKRDLNNIVKSICGIRGAYESLKSYLEINEDEARLSALQHLREPLQECKDVLDILKDRLQKTFIVDNRIVGNLGDSKLKKGLQRLDNAKELFDLILHVDQL